jgi:hypothetical protein
MYEVHRKGIATVRSVTFPSRGYVPRIYAPKEEPAKRAALGPKECGPWGDFYGDQGSPDSKDPYATEKAKAFVLYRGIIDKCSHLTL